MIYNQSINHLKQKGIYPIFQNFSFPGAQSAKAHPFLGQSHE
jgi:hypothetical protein